MSEIIKVMLSLLIVLGVIAGTARVMKGRSVSTTGLLRTLGYLSLGPRKGIAIVKAGREVMLLAVTPNDLKLLKTIPEEDVSVELASIKDNIKQIKGLKERFLKTATRK